MSHSLCLGGCCQDRTSGTQGSDEDGQRAGGASGSDRFTRRSGHPLRSRTDALARVDAVRFVLRNDRALPTDLGAHGACSDHDAGARRWDHTQRRSHRALGPVADCGSAVRPTRRTSRIGTSRRPLRSAAPDLRRDGSRLGLVPRPPRSADAGVCERYRLPRRRCCHRSRRHRRGGFGSTARPSCACRCRARRPRAQRRTCRWPSRSSRAGHFAPDHRVDRHAHGTAAYRSSAPAGGAATRRPR